MPTIAAIGHSTARWSLDTLETIEPGISIHPSHEFLGGRSWWLWWDRIDPQAAPWDTFETDVDATQPDAVWMMIPPRDPAVFPGEPLLTLAQSLEILTFARSITDDGGPIPYFINETPPYENCSALKIEQYEFARATALYLQGQPNCFPGPRLLPVVDQLTYDNCHANDPLRNDQALILQSWFGAGGSAWA